MKRKEIIEELSEIKTDIMPGIPVEIVQNKVDKLIDKLQMDEIEEEKPNISVTVNINHPSELEEIEESVENVMHKIQRLNDLGRL